MLLETRLRTELRRLREPHRVAGVVLLVALAFTVCRWAVVDHGDLSRNILVNRANAPGSVPPNIHVFPDTGYDGQFYYRFAVAPDRLSGLVDGIQVDDPLRQQRIGYPVVVWLLSAGQHAAVPYVLVAVNVLGLAVLAWAGAAVARSYGRHPAWGLAFCCFPGFVFCLARDLTEIVSSALLVCGLLAIRRDRPWLAAGALAAGVLTRETVLLVVGALAATRAWRILRGRARPGAPDAAWLLPAAAFAGWQVYVTSRYGRCPLLAERANTAVPGAAMLGAVRRWLTHPQVLTSLFLLAVVLLAALAAGALLAGRDRIVTVALAAAVLLAVSLSADVWNGDPVEVRTFVEIHLLGVLALLPARTPPLVLYTGASAALTALSLGTFAILAS